MVFRRTMAKRMGCMQYPWYRLCPCRHDDSQWLTLSRFLYFFNMEMTRNDLCELCLLSIGMRDLSSPFLVCCFFLSFWFMYCWATHTNNRIKNMREWRNHQLKLWTIVAGDWIVEALPFLPMLRNRPNHLTFHSSRSRFSSIFSIHICSFKYFEGATGKTATLKVLNNQNRRHWWDSTTSVDGRSDLLKWKSLEWFLDAR